MALPEKYPKFPTLAERQNMIAQLKEAAEKGDALSSSQHFPNYLDKLTALDKLMNQYSEIDEVFGIPPTLDASGQKKLLQALTDTAVAGETFLADAQRRIEEDPRVAEVAFDPIALFRSTVDHSVERLEDSQRPLHQRNS